GNLNGQKATVKGDITSEDGWLITRNNKGWMNTTHGGGFTMTDSQWIRAVNNKGITTEGELKGGKVSGGTVRSEGRLSTGEYLQLDKTATAGTSCSPDGLVGRDSKGAILSCQSGVWVGGNKVNYSACKWYEATSAHFIGGRSGGSIYYKPIQCPAGYVMTGTRMYGIGDGVDEEHVDAYCCPFG
ncbi:TPA: shufflon system plasmid conjugative transfer pilus tip adhesin PilV, partial [Escherichia coli]|nr:shufflon system plasmid conjugative transfer pilus tip adhesin PilV [Escherichia coli]